MTKNFPSPQEIISSSALAQVCVGVPGVRYGSDNLLPFTYTKPFRLRKTDSPDVAMIRFTAKPPSVGSLMTTMSPRCGGRTRYTQRLR